MTTRIIHTFFFVLVVVSCVGWTLQRAKKEQRRTDYLNNLPAWSSESPATDVNSPTGYEGGQRVLTIPGHNKQSFDLIAVAQQMIVQKKNRIDRIDHANAPTGHPTHLSSVLSWLLSKATLYQQRGHQNAGQAVEKAAQAINLQILLFGTVTLSIVAAYAFGFLPAAMLCVGLSAMYPLTGTFVSGTPNVASLGVLFSLYSILTLLAGVSATSNGATANSMQPGRIYFAVSGIFGAFALWMDLPAVLPLVGGLAVSGVLLSISSKASTMQRLPWRTWGVAGAATILLGYFIDYLPARGELVLRSIHPFYAVVWLGVAEAITQLNRAQTQTAGWSRQRILFLMTAFLVMAAVPIVLFYTKADLYSIDGPDAFRLDPNSGVAAPNLAGWLTQEGLSVLAVTTLLPLLIAIIAALGTFFLLDANQRVLLGLAVGLVVPSFVLGARQLSLLCYTDGAALTVMVVVVATLLNLKRWRWALALTTGFLLSLLPAIHKDFRPSPADASLSPAEFEGFVERDLAHWLSQHSASTPTVLAPPRVTSALTYYGGAKGIGTFDRDNPAGTNAAIRIVSASSAEEAFALIDARKITHIVIPFWDTYLQQYLRLGVGEVAGSDRIEYAFLTTLQRWQLPAWLRAVPYRLPPGPGVDGSVIIFEVVEDQSPAVAASRLVEYFIEMDQLDTAKEKARELAQYPSDLSALAAACAVAASTNDVGVLEPMRTKLLLALERPERRRLAWDRRVSLAIVLAQQKQSELAKIQLGKCLSEIDTHKIQSLSTISLYRFALLCKLYGMEITDPNLKMLSRDLLRPDLRARL